MNSYRIVKSINYGVHKVTVNATEEITNISPIPILEAKSEDELLEMLADIQDCVGTYDVIEDPVFDDEDDDYEDVFDRMKGL